MTISEATPASPHAAATTRPTALLTLVCATAFMVVLGTTTVVTALPSITRDLDLGVTGAQWVVTAYAICYGALMLVGGRLADVYGRRQVFVAGVAAFVVTSAIGGAAPSAGWLLGARLLQGISAAVVVPASLALVVAAFAEGAPRNRAMGIWNAVAGAGGTIGLVVAGPLTDGPGWRWIFLLNVPAGIAALVAAPRLLPRLPRTRGVRIDVRGGAAATGTLLALVYGLTRSSDAGLGDPLAIGALVLSGSLAAWFLRTERRATQPLVPLRLLRNRAVLGGNAVLVVTGAAVGFFFTLSLYAQEVLGYSASDFGMATIATGLSSVAAGLATPALVTRWGSKSVVIGGLVALGAALLLLARVPPDADYLRHLFGPLLLAGVGIGICGVAASIAALTGVSEQDAGVASGVEESTWAVGEPLGVALMATIAAVVTSARLGDGASALDASADGYRAAFLLGASFCALGILAAASLLPGRTGSAHGGGGG